MSTPPFNQSECDRIASEWIVRGHHSLTQDHQRERDLWLAADPRHAATYERLRSTWSVFDRARDQGMADLIAAKAERRVRRRQHRLQLLAVATVAVVAAFWWAPRWSSAPAATSVVTEVIRKLPDGSIVELNGDAEIAVDYTTAHRDIRLVRGEAHFRVEKDPARPFRVTARSIEVVAVGTAFTVSLDPHDVEVVVTHGRVAIDEKSPATPANAELPRESGRTLDAGHRIRFRDPSSHLAHVEQIALNDDEIDQRLAWRQVRLAFDGVPLARAVADFNRVNHLQIAVADDATGALAVSGVFRSDNPEGFIRIVEKTFDLQASRDSSGQIVLRRR